MKVISVAAELPDVGPQHTGTAVLTVESTDMFTANQHFLITTVDQMAVPVAEAKLRDHAFSVDLHPSQRLLAAGLITGQLKLFEWDEAQSASSAEPQRLRQRWSSRPHKEEACRVAKFSADGATIFSAGGDCTLQQRDVGTNKPVWRMRHAAASPVNAMVRLSEVGVATGDDEGAVICWDLRSKVAALKFHENCDYVSDMLYVERAAGASGSQHTLVVAGGDGYLSVFDLRAGRLWARSDPQEDELLCLSLCKRGRKLCCGTQEGEVHPLRCTHCSLPCTDTVATTHQRARQASSASSRGAILATSPTGSRGIRRRSTAWCLTPTISC